MKPHPDRPRVRETYVVTRRALRGLYASPIPQMAAALSYRTIFGLIPVLVVSLVALKFFTNEDDIRSLVARALEFSGISQIAVDAPAPEGVGPPIDQPAGGGADPQPLEAWIHERIAAVRAVPFQAIGWIGLATLIYAAISMLVEVEHAYNRIYRAKEGRGWGRRLTQYWTVLTLGSVALFATFYVGEQFKSWVRQLTHDGAMSGGGVILSLAGFSVTVAISTLLFLFTYTTVPNTRVKFSPALAGAFLAAIAWETGKWGFTQYLHYSASFERLYGSIALIPLFLLWVYVTWLVVLLGLQVSFGLQTFRQRRRDDDAEPALVDPACVLAVAAHAARRFMQGKPTDALSIAGRTGFSTSMSSRILERLAQSGLLVRVKEPDAKDEPGPEDDRYSLARPPALITGEQVLRAAHEIAFKPTAGDSPDPASEFVDSLRAAQLDAGRGVTLDRLVESPGTPNA